MILPILEPMLLGAIPLGGAAALVAYVLVRFAVGGYQQRPPRAARSAQAHARRGERRRCRHDHRHRQRPHRHPPGREGRSSATASASPSASSPTSRTQVRAARARAASYAKRFAAKEACAKALGTGMRARRLLARHGRGQPAVRQADHGAHRRRGQAARRADPARPRAEIHVTITDDFPLAQAFVIIEAVPDDVP